MVWEARHWEIIAVIRQEGKTIWYINAFTWDYVDGEYIQDAVITTWEIGDGDIYRDLKGLLKWLQGFWISFDDLYF